MTKTRMGVTVREDQKEWLEDNDVNVSKLLRQAIDKERDDLSGIENFKQ